MKNLKFLVLTFMLSSSVSFAQTGPATSGAKSKPTKEMPTLSKEDREKLAGVHEKMATCLRSDRTMQDCHEEMRKAHEAAGMGMGMMEMCHDMGMGKGKGMKMRHQKMMQEETKTTEEKK